jgi:hypothetical protein
VPIKSKKTKPATVGLRQIAASAHVNLATLSRVINGNNRVDPVIQKAVMDAAAKFGAFSTTANFSRQFQRSAKFLYCVSLHIPCNGHTDTKQKINEMLQNGSIVRNGA